MNVCLFCSEPIFGRADKKYCDVQCKNSFHNASLKKRPSTELLVLQRILQNRVQFQSLLGASMKTEVSYDDLKNRGVDINFFTHIDQQSGGELRCCFEFGLQLHEQMVSVVRLDLELL